MSSKNKIYIPIQKCYPDEYSEYNVINEYIESCNLPVQMFCIRFAKDVDMVLFPHACTLIYFDIDKNENINMKFVGRVTETMCTKQLKDNLYIIFRFPPQFVSEKFKGIVNSEKKLDLNLFGEKYKLLKALNESCLKARFNSIMNIIHNSNIVIKKNKLIDEFITNSISNIENNTIESIIGSMSYSPRYVRSIIKKYTGINAKRLYDIIRLQNIIESQFYDDSDCLSCAYENGFYDQAHLNKNIRKLTGLSYTSFKLVLREKNI